MIKNKFHLSNLIGIRYEHFLSMLKTPHNYTTFIIKQKNGKNRIINSPKFELRIAQEFILNYILPSISPHEKSCAFEIEKSILNHAKFHKNSNWAINLDIKDFFSTISSWYVYRVFLEIYNYNEEVSQVLSKLCCYNSTLPQGSPTSPYLSNIFFKNLDIYFDDFFKEEGLVYSRYGDDITISGQSKDKNQREMKWKYVNKVQKKISEVGLSLNYSKIRYYEGSLKITGLVVENQLISVPQKYIRSVTQELYYIKKYSLAEHLKKKFVFEKNPTVYIEELKGKLMWIKQVNFSQYQCIISEYEEVLKTLN